MVNFWANGGQQFYYSSELMSCLGNKNFEFNELMGESEPFVTVVAGLSTLKYKAMQERIDNYLGKWVAVVTDCETANSGTLPLDTLIRVNEITGGDQYEKIKNKSE